MNSSFGLFVCLSSALAVLVASQNSPDSAFRNFNNNNSDQNNGTTAFPQSLPSGQVFGTGKQQNEENQDQAGAILSGTSSSTNETVNNSTAESNTTMSSKITNTTDDDEAMRMQDECADAITVTDRVKCQQRAEMGLQSTTTAAENGTMVETDEAENYTETPVGAFMDSNTTESSGEPFEGSTESPELSENSTEIPEETSGIIMEGLSTVSSEASEKPTGSSTVIPVLPPVVTTVSSGPPEQPSEASTISAGAPVELFGASTTGIPAEPSAGATVESGIPSEPVTVTEFSVTVTEFAETVSTEETTTAGAQMSEIQALLLLSSGIVSFLLIVPF